MGKRGPAAKVEAKPKKPSSGDRSGTMEAHLALAGIASKKPCQVNDVFQVRVGKDGRVYLANGSFPSYVEDDILAILLDCGFTYSQGFRHELLDIKCVDHEDEVRQLLIHKGLPPNLEADAQEETDPATLRRWVAFANVPIRESDSARVLQNLPLPSDHQALLWLGKLGFRVDGETQKIYRPTGDDGDLEEYGSVSEIRAFVRSADNGRLLSAAAEADLVSPRKRARRATRKQDMPLTDQEFLSLRLWGALSPTPLPIFGQPFEPDWNDDDDMMVDKVESAPVKVPASKKPAKKSIVDTRAVREPRATDDEVETPTSLTSNETTQARKNNRAGAPDRERDQEDINEGSSTSGTGPGEATAEYARAPAGSSDMNNEPSKNVQPMERPQTYLPVAAASSCVIL